ncbi:MAG: transporter [Acidobacteriota bacterium]
MSDADLSKESVNPVTRQITLPLRYEAEFNDGAYKATKDTFEIDNAIVPFRLSEDWALITRTKLPAIVQPPKKHGEHWTTGLGNGETTFFLSPERGEGFYWGVGPVLSFPSATNSALGVHRWGSGPSAAFVKKDESPWVFAAVVNNIWSLGSGPNNSDRTDSFLLNPSVSYHFGDGWSVGSSPNITANWIANGEKWTVPIGGGLSKVIRFGDQPVKLAVDAYYNAIREKSSNDTAVLQFTLTFLFPD